MAGSAGGERAVVLVVDDDPAVRMAIRHVLEEDFEIVEADSGYEALRQVRAARFDAVLLDVLLPDVDGLEVLRQIRRGAAAPPVVLVTGVTVLRTAVEAMKLGAVDYVSKPFAPDGLLAAVRDAAGRGARGVDAHGRDGGLQVRIPIAVIGGDAPARASLALLLDSVAPVERFTLGAPWLPTRELACAVVLAGRGVDPATVVHALEHLARRTAVFLAAADTRPPHAWPPVDPRGVFPLGDWSALVTAVRRHLAPGRPGLGDHVGRAVEYMTAHHGRALTVGDIAAAIGVSESHLAHLFPEETGFTVRRFLRALRLELARELVAAGDDKLETIARRLAFADGPHLSRALGRAAARPSARQADPSRPR